MEHEPVAGAVLAEGTLDYLRELQSALRRGLDTRCACMGTVLDVPLSHVTLTEDIGMIAMAAIMLTTL